MREDPIGFSNGDENLYFYVRNNPTIFFDTDGLQIKVRRPIVLPGHGHVEYGRNKARGYIVRYDTQDYTYYPARPPQRIKTLMGIDCLTKELGHGIVITEGQRTAEDEAILKKKKVRYIPGGYHTQGLAIDVRANADAKKQKAILCAAANCGFSCGFAYPSEDGGHVHLDMRDYKCTKSYKLPDPILCKCEKYRYLFK